MGLTRGGGFPLFSIIKDCFAFGTQRCVCCEVLLEVAGPEDEQSLHGGAYIIAGGPFERFHVAFAKAVAGLVRVCGAHIKLGAFLVDACDHGEGRLFTGGKLNPNDISAHKVDPCGNSVGIDIGGHGNVYLAEIRQSCGFELLVHFLGGAEFGNSLCHGLKDS